MVKFMVDILPKLHRVETDFSPILTPAATRSSSANRRAGPGSCEPAGPIVTLCVLLHVQRPGQAGVAVMVSVLVTAAHPLMLRFHASNS